MKQTNRLFEMLAYGLGRGWTIGINAAVVIWPTLLTIPMYPILILVYLWLARKEDRDLKAAFGAEYEAYRAVTPAFFPKLTLHKPIGEPKPTNLG